MIWNPQRPGPMPFHRYRSHEDRVTVLADPDLDSLRGLPRFRKMMAATAKRLGVELEPAATPAAS